MPEPKLFRQIWSHSFFANGQQIILLIFFYLLSACSYRNYPKMHFQRYAPKVIRHEKSCGHHRYRGRKIHYKSEIPLSQSEAACGTMRLFSHVWINIKWSLCSHSGCITTLRHGGDWYTLDGFNIWYTLDVSNIFYANYSNFIGQP